MPEKITVPTLGESVTEATVSKWLKSQGDKVTADEPVVELETDKVNVEVPAPSNGVIGSIAVKEGETVNVGSILGVIDDNVNQEKNKSKEIKNYTPPKKNHEKPPQIFEKEKIIPKKSNKNIIEESILKLDESFETEQEPLILEKIHKDKPSAKKISSTKKKDTNISPAARKMATEANVDLNQIHGTGKNGVILKEDIMSLMGSKPSPSERKIKHGPEERVKMTRLPFFLQQEIY